MPMRRACEAHDSCAVPPSRGEAALAVVPRSIAMVRHNKSFTRVVPLEGQPPVRVGSERMRYAHAAAWTAPLAPLHSAYATPCR